MGLQGHVSDCSSESMFIFILAMVANFVSYLRSVSFLILRSMGLSQFDPDVFDEGGSGDDGFRIRESHRPRRPAQSEPASLLLL
ncbi:hypothetical protein HYC85_021482 [Camellia sinensis]|uniref:Uncharacterized protein n=1 Tax=Camellia sinensis TaxID=4442 RepID=A0A7J7GJB9_CAMSI|nr:hypothetical protein HYC85_021482 [Camellia sinensis]